MNNEAQNFIKPTEKVDWEKQLSELQVAQLHAEARNKRETDWIHEKTDDRLASLMDDLKSEFGEESEMVVSWETFANVNTNDISRVSDNLNIESLNILENSDIDNYLPEEYKVTKHEYIVALSDLSVREEVLVKVQWGLQHLSPSMAGTSAVTAVNILSFNKPDNKAIALQELYIDLKDELRSIA